MTDQMQQTDELRRLAVSRLRKRRDFGAHALAYVLVNAFIVGIWMLTGPDGFFWPMFPMFGWGIGLAFHAWDVYAQPVPTEEQIRHEMDKLARR